MKAPQQSEILVLGLARNIESVLGREVTSIQIALRPFRSVRFLVLESDSSDNTLAVLRDLNESRTNFEFLSLGTLQHIFPNRIDRLTHCRNELMKVAARYRESCDYVALADLDGVNNEISEEGVMSCWKYSKWDVMTANQRCGYYDAYALRHPQLSPNDCWQEYKRLRKSGLHPMRARRAAVSSRQIYISEDYDLVEVESAFGGFAIYTKEAYFSSSYSSLDKNGEITCEHVTFHSAMRDQGFKIYINPKMVNSEGIRKMSFVEKIKFLTLYSLSFVSPQLYVRRFGE